MMVWVGDCGVEYGRGCVVKSSGAAGLLQAMKLKCMYELKFEVGETGEM